MGKKKNIGSLGRALIKDSKMKSRRLVKNTSMLHTSEVQEIQRGVNIESITEESDAKSVLAAAVLAGSEFKAERLNTVFVKKSNLVGVLTTEEHKKIKQIQDQNRAFLRIPRRPKWDRTTSAEELTMAECDSFLDWRQSLVGLQDEDGIVLTPYEKNLEFWRQLWRVIERSDVVVQIVDARNPMLYWCADLCSYVKEVSGRKMNLLLVNKADFLTQEQRQRWSIFFEQKGIKAVFFSAIQDKPEILKEEEEEDDEFDIPPSPITSDEEDFVSAPSSPVPFIEDDYEDVPTIFDENDSNDETMDASQYVNTDHVLTRAELINVFCNIYKGQTMLGDGRVTVGLVGYPNVGKSSTINCLLEEKKVSVTATPGRTKHFQTIFLKKDLLLCDCPGLVFPAFLMSKAEMITSGILPIDKMRDHVAPMNVVLSQVPRRVMELTYGVSIPLPPEGDDPNRSPTSEEFLTIYAFHRGFMAQCGIPNHPHGARYILKDFICGKLLYCHCPPSENQEEFHTFSVAKERKILKEATPQQLSLLSSSRAAKAVDDSFFLPDATVHCNGRKGLTAIRPIVTKGTGDHLLMKRDQRVKLRRKFGHHDD